MSRATLAALAMAVLASGTAIFQAQRVDPVERAALSFLVELEGIELREYDDGAGYRTCGVGHVMTTGEKCPSTVESALQLLADDYRKKSSLALAGIGGASAITSMSPLLLSSLTSVAMASAHPRQGNCLMQGYSTLSPTQWRVGTRLERDEEGRWSSGPVWSTDAPKSGACGKENENAMAAKTTN